MPSLAIWTPSLTGAFSENYVKSVTEVQQLCVSEGIQFSWNTISKCSMLPAVRNKCVHEFMKSNATHMLFLDSDLGIDAKDVIDCIKSDLDFTSLPYCQRHIEPFRLMKMVRVMDPVNADKIKAMLAGPTHQTDKVYENNEKASSLGYKRVDAVGTGAAIIKRDVFTKLSDFVGEYIDFHSYQTESEIIKNYFKYSIDLDGNYVGEDYAFCYTWTSIGGEIYIKEDAVTSHTGSVDYIYDKEVL